MAEKRFGILITLIAGIAWGLSGVSGQYLMSRGVSVDMITSLRLLVSGFFLVGLAYATAKEQLLIVLKNRKALLGIFVLRCWVWFLTRWLIYKPSIIPMRERLRSYNTFALS